MRYVWCNQVNEWLDPNTVYMGHLHPVHCIQRSPPPPRAAFCARRTRSLRRSHCTPSITHAWFKVLGLGVWGSRVGG